MRHIFISDLHLCKAREDLKKAYFDFCSSTIKPGDTLYILGDFFDAWIGDDEDDPFYLNIKRQLKILSETVCIYFIHGNRDFLIGKQFEIDTGIILLPDPTPITLAGRRCLLMHGDSLCTDDHEYMLFRAQARSKPWQNHILSMPLEQRRQVAKELRTKSNNLNSNKSEDIMDVAQVSVENTFKQYHVDTIIHGHTHRPKIHHYTINNQTHQRIVLGDWDQTGWFMMIDETKVDNNPFTLTRFTL